MSRQRRSILLAVTMAAGVSLASVGVMNVSGAGLHQATGRDGADPPTFTGDVAPILFTECAPCHRSGGAAPFSLLTHAEARARAEQIASVTSRRIMPPWKPEPGYGEFDGEQRLTDEQIGVIRRWFEGGAPEGDPAQLPPVPTWTSEWQLGEPDLVLETAPYVLPPGRDDVYRNFVLPLPAASTRYVRAWQLLPGSSHVHHATMQFDPTGESRRFDAQDPAPGYEGLIPHTVQSVEGFFLGWTPGHAAYIAPDGMAWPLSPETDLVMMLHLRPHDRPAPIQVKLGLYFSDGPPTLLPTVVRLTRQNLDIPPGLQRYVVTDSFTLDVDVDAYTVQPHAHYLAREVRAFASLPSGARAPLILIRDWDFDWQGIYRFKQPVFLPAGTTVTMEYVYDNSSGNPRNPHDAPRRVTFGQQTTDEMAELWLQVVTRNPGDRLRLSRAVQAKVMREELVGLEKRLETETGDVALLNDAAMLHVAAGNLERALDRFLEARRLEPSAPAGHYNVGNVLLGLGRAAEAAGLFATALALKPDYALAHDGLGLARQAQGDFARAIEHHREAIRIDGGDADARVHLAAALRLSGRLEDARAAYREALRIEPGHVRARAELTSLEQQIDRRPQ